MISRIYRMLTRDWQSLKYNLMREIWEHLYAAEIKLLCLAADTGSQLEQQQISNYLRGVNGYYFEPIVTRYETLYTMFNED